MSSGSNGFQSFFKYLRNDNSEPIININQKETQETSSESSSSTSNLTLDLNYSSADSTGSSTSCDSLFSIATTGFNFIPVDIYQPDGLKVKIYL